MNITKVEKIAKVDKTQIYFLRDIEFVKIKLPT